MICAIEGDFASKGAPRLCAVKSFQMGSHVNQQVPDTFVKSSLPIESFLRFHTFGVPNTQLQAGGMRSNSTSSVQE